jgi:hypothetical protein
MSVYYITYDLHKEGYIHNWLLAGPQAIPVPDLDRFGEEDFQLQVARQYYEEDSGITQPPQEWEPHFTIGEDAFYWRYTRCLEDHFIDLSTFYSTCHYLRAWTYAEVRCPQAQEVSLILSTHGPADLWLNGQHLHRQEQFQDQEPRGDSFPAVFQEGHNDILIRFEEVGMRECAYAMALRIAGLSSDGVSVMLPTPVMAIARRQTLETMIEAAYLDRYVYGRNDEVVVRWHDTLGVSAPAGVRFQNPEGWIFMDVWRARGAASEVCRLVRGFEVPEGAYQVLVQPRPEEYYEDNQRVRKRINLHIVKTDYSLTPYGNFDQRRWEALETAARPSDDLFSELAKMELERWSRLETDVIREAIEGVNQRRAGSLVDLVGLLGMTYWYLEDPAFPQEFRDPLQECILNFRYWTDEPGSDAMDYRTESHQILFHTCQLLAGQLYPDRIFTNAGQGGRRHREQGEHMALSWLRKRAAYGFREWDSNTSFEQDLVALVHLADLAQSAPVWELAAAVMDKMLFTMALNSYRGVFGSTHGRSDPRAIQSARLDSSGGVSRLMWGLGVFNNHIAGTVSLACAKGYGLPGVIERIARHLPEGMWNREHHAGELEEWCDGTTGSWEVNKVTYRMPEYMLCSAQDYQAGERGDQEHVWQATLGPDAVVFVTHPPCMSEEQARQPNFWCGNRILPRVAQWRDVLVAIHNLPSDDWLGFTHAYFPLQAFDEHLLRDGWAFARKGEGYVALTAAEGMRLITRGQSAYRELRSHGVRNVWVCHMGRAAQDGSFGEFQERVLALDVVFEGLSVRCATLRGETLTFDWEGRLMVDGKEQAITGFQHYENPYCSVDWPATEMGIHFGDQSLALNFNGSQEVS